MLSTYLPQNSFCGTEIIFANPTHKKQKKGAHPMTVDEFLQMLNDQLEKGKEKGGGEDEF